MYFVKVDAGNESLHFGGFKPVEAEEADKAPNGFLRIHYWYMFSNGFGASVARNEFSYGGCDGLFELAVADSSYNIRYDTPIARSAIGRLTEKEVVEILEKIEALPPREELEAED